MSPAISFSIFRDRLLDGTKCQTIRKPRKRPLKMGDKLYVFWKLRTKECERLGTTRVINVEPKRGWSLTEEDAKKDGFVGTELHSPRFVMEEFFKLKYPQYSPSMLLEVISFEPLKKDLTVSVKFGTFEEFWKYCNGGCPNYKEGCASTCELRRKLKISPFGTFKWQGEIPKNRLDVETK